MIMFSWHLPQHQQVLLQLADHRDFFATFKSFLPWSFGEFPLLSMRLRGDL